MRYISSLCLLVCCIWLSGCQADENLRSANETGLLITLTDESDHAYARTIPSALEKPVADMFHLRVAYSGTDNVAYDDKCTESILLKEGTYDLTATYGENPGMSRRSRRSAAASPSPRTAPASRPRPGR